MRYPYSRPDLREEDIAAATAVLHEDMLTQGPRIQEFETAFSEQCDGAHTVACSNGTAALHLAYMALGVGPDAGAIVPSVTFLATANAARMCGAPVHFADVDPDTGRITPQTLAAAIESCPFPVRVAAAVHLGGAACDMAGLRATADAAGLALVEDACHAPGARYRDSAGDSFAVGACAHSDASTFSFHAIKHVSAGEGGAVTTRASDLAERMARLRTHGIERAPERFQHAPAGPAPWYYEMHELGWNYRLTDFQAALARSQLPRLAEGVAHRERLAEAYHAALADLPGVDLPALSGPGERFAWHLFAPRLDFEGHHPSRGAVMTALRDKGIGSQVHYIPLHRQPYYRIPGALFPPGAERYYARALSLPMYRQLEVDDVWTIADALKEVLQS